MSISRVESQRKYRAKKKTEKAKLKSEARKLPPDKKQLSPTYELVENEARAIDGLTSQLQKIQVTTVLRAGKLLEQAHEKLANYGDGVFIKWCNERLGINRKKAERWRKVYFWFGKEDWDILTQSFQPTALYKLADPKVPDDIRELTMKQAENGKQITNSWVNTILEVERNAKPREKPEPNEDRISLKDVKPTTIATLRRDFGEALKRLPGEKVMLLYSQFSDFWEIIIEEIDCRYSPKKKQEMRKLMKQFMDSHNSVD